MPAADADVVGAERASIPLPDVVGPHRIAFDPPVGASEYRDRYGNMCHRIVAPAGLLRISTQFVVGDPGTPDGVVPDAMQHPIQDLPEESLVYLLGSRYCETDRLTPLAWSLFSTTPEGWPRVQAICDYVHDRIEFGYHHADPTRTAYMRPPRRPRRVPRLCPPGGHVVPLHEHSGAVLHRLSRRYRHPAGRCADGFQRAGSRCILGGHWHTFDARHNTPRIGRILMARGRDATDVALSTIFGPSSLVGFNVVTDEVA